MSMFKERMRNPGEFFTVERLDKNGNVIQDVQVKTDAKQQVKQKVRDEMMKLFGSIH